MKRPLGLWILLSAGVLWLNNQDVHGARATSLVFAKTSTTTTPSSKTSSSDKKSDSSEEEPDTTEAHIEGTPNSTKPALTGIPQIDYIWDPNLPKELNGYNLSDYPFYERVPGNITFKCDGLHDGFYASVLHKCQVYHHCLFGIRYDFLCANYTAFDQTLFNCNFVSKVDCENSKKFWSRNDELYKTVSTTPPPVVYNFYTKSPPMYPAQGPLIRRRMPQRRLPAFIPAETPIEQVAPQATQTASAEPVDVPADQPPQPPIDVSLEPRRRTRPPMRLRPHYDYYDDYEDTPRYMRKRPRPRPYYDDDDYEYYDDRYYRRNEGRRRPYDRPMRRYKGRRDRYEGDEEYEEAHDKDDRYADEDSGTRKGNRGGVTAASNQNSRKKTSKMPQNSGKPNRRPIDDEYEEYDDKLSNKRPRIEPARNRNPNRRLSHEYEDDQLEETSYKNRKGSSSEIPLDESKTIIKPTSGTIFDQPRVAPKINLPVPKNVADKYSYKAMSAKSKEEVRDVDEEEDEKEETPSSDNSQEKLSSSTEIPDAVTTIKGNAKRSFKSRRQTTEGKSNIGSPNVKMQPPQPNESEEVDETIQEGRATMRPTSVRVKNQSSKDFLEVTENPKKDTRRPESQERARGTSRFNNMYMTRHSLSTPEAIDIEDADHLIEIDDSINEA